MPGGGRSLNVALAAAMAAGEAVRQLGAPRCRTPPCGGRAHCGCRRRSFGHGRPRLRGTDRFIGLQVDLRSSGNFRGSIRRRQSPDRELDHVAGALGPTFDLGPVGLLRPAVEPFARLLPRVGRGSTKVSRKKPSRGIRAFSLRERSSLFFSASSGGLAGVANKELLDPLPHEIRDRLAKKRVRNVRSPADRPCSAQSDQIDGAPGNPGRTAGRYRGQEACRARLVRGAARQDLRGLRDDRGRARPVRNRPGQPGRFEKTRLAARRRQGRRRR